MRNVFKYGDRVILNNHFYQAVEGTVVGVEWIPRFKGSGETYKYTVETAFPSSRELRVVEEFLTPVMKKSS